MPCHLVRIFLLFWTLWYLLLAELLNLLVLVMEVVATEEACVGWTGRKQLTGQQQSWTVFHHSLWTNCHSGWGLCLLLWFRNLSTQSSADILQRSARIHAAVKSSYHRFWMSTSVKLKLYNTCLCPTLLYNLECCAITKDCKIDSLN